jgi:hypothetical protein
MVMSVAMEYKIRQVHTAVYPPPVTRCSAALVGVSSDLTKRWSVQPPKEEKGLPGK